MLYNPRGLLCAYKLVKMKMTSRMNVASQKKNCHRRSTGPICQRSPRHNLHVGYRLAESIDRSTSPDISRTSTETTTSLIAAVAAVVRAARAILHPSHSIVTPAASSASVVDASRSASAPAPSHAESNHAPCARRRSYGHRDSAGGNAPSRREHPKQSRGRGTSDTAQSHGTVDGTSASERVARARACHDARAAATQRGARTHTRAPGRTRALSRPLDVNPRQWQRPNDRSESASAPCSHPVGSARGQYDSTVTTRFYYGLVLKTKKFSKFSVTLNLMTQA